jgi:sugar phosphate isomerase/epimerase
MKIDQVAIQLYTLRDFCKTTEDYAATLKKVREIGYRAIQISATGPIPVTELRSIAEGEGLTICATHEPAQKILTETQSVVDRLAALGCKYTAYPYPDGVELGDPAAVARLAADLDAAGAILREAGLALGYHNHALELFKLNGETVLETLYRCTSPENLFAELDTYWLQAGGADPVAWCRRLKGRLPLLHLKDYAVGPNGQVRFGEIGAGNLDFKAIIAAAEESGCEWFIVEQDSCPGDPFVSIKQSFDYIQANLVG